MLLDKRILVLLLTPCLVTSFLWRKGKKDDGEPIDPADPNDPIDPPVDIPPVDIPPVENPTDPDYEPNPDFYPEYGRDEKKIRGILNRGAANVDRMVQMLQDQIDTVSRNYEERIEGVRARFMQLDNDLMSRYRELQTEFNHLTYEYESLEDRYEDYDDRCEYNQRQMYEQALLFHQQQKMELEEREEFYKYLVDTQGEMANDGDTSESPSSLQNMYNHRSSYNKTSLKYGWELAFRAVRGNGQSVYDAWQGKGSYKRFSRDCDKPYCYTCGHWRSFKVDDWEELGIKEVKIELYKDDARVAWIQLDGVGTTKDNWFEESRILDSSWNFQSAIDTMDSHGPFPGVYYMIHLADTTAACAGNLGWMVILDNGFITSTCNFFATMTYPAFLYSPSDDLPYEDMQHADLFTIWIKYDNSGSIMDRW